VHPEPRSLRTPSRYSTVIHVRNSPVFLDLDIESIGLIIFSHHHAWLDNSRLLGKFGLAKGRFRRRSLCQRLSCQLGQPHLRLVGAHVIGCDSRNDERHVARVLLGSSGCDVKSTVRCACEDFADSMHSTERTVAGLRVAGLFK
jgi:hypothetical protein